MTSNIGSQFIGEHEDEDVMRRKVVDALRAQFRPEFLNRVDDIIVFHPLSEVQLKQIVRIQVERLKKHLEQKKIGLVLTDEAAEILVTIGYDPVYGARPLKRAITREILNPLAMQILEGKFKEGDTVEVGVEKSGFTFRPAQVAEAA